MVISDLSSNQVEILELIGGEQGNYSERRWWSAVEVIAAIGHGTGPGMGCAMKGLFKRSLLRRFPALRREGRRKTLYQVTDEGLRVLELVREERKSR